MSSKSGTVKIANFSSIDCTSQVYTPSTAPGWIAAADARQFNFPVNQNGGGKVSTGAGFTTITAFCNSVSWGPGGNSTTTTPSGGGSWVPGNHATFPNADRHAVILFQVKSSNNDGSAEVIYQQIEGTNASNATTFSGYDSTIPNLYVTVNDAIGIYGDNTSGNQNNTVTCTIALNSNS